MVPDEELNEAVLTSRGRLPTMRRCRCAASKLTINEMLKDESKRDMAAMERMISEICFNSADYKEGRTAFMEKRPPRFLGR